MKKSLIVLASACLSALLTSCIKSSEPVVFDGYQVTPSSVPGLGSILARSNVNPVVEVLQLRTEGNETYLYVCDRPGVSEVKKIRAYVSAIPNQTGLYVLALEVGNFFVEDDYANSLFHELFLLQPLGDQLIVRILDTSHGDSIAEYFRGVSRVPLAVENGYGAQAYTAEQIKGFLTNHADEYMSEGPEEEGYSYTYYNGMMDICAWN